MKKRTQKVKPHITFLNFSLIRGAFFTGHEFRKRDDVIRCDCGLTIVNVPPTFKWD